MFDWLQQLADTISYDMMSLSEKGRLGPAVSFFIYDTAKIIILLFFITFAMGIVNSYLPIERIRNFLSTRKLYGFEYLLAALFGAVTPFCSCSSVPLFIGFVKGGIPLGVTFAFLITSPLVNEVAVAVFLGAFGLKVTAVYTLTGILLGVVGGAVLGRMKLEPLLTSWVQKLWESAEHERELFKAEKISFYHRLPAIGKEALGIVKGVTLYIIAGIAVGAVMHGYVPEGFFTRYLGGDTWYSVPIAVLLGVPMYANAAGIVPIAQVFVAKGIPIGTTLAFMMAVVGLSLPEATLLKKVMTTRLILIFFGVVAVCIIIAGSIFNVLLS